MVDFAEINERALEDFDDVMEWLGLEGKDEGAEFVAYCWRSCRTALFWHMVAA